MRSAQKLHDRLAALGGATLIEHLDDILAGKRVSTEQDEDRTTYAPKIEKQDAAIDWSLPAVELVRRVRAPTTRSRVPFVLLEGLRRWEGLQAQVRG